VLEDAFARLGGKSEDIGEVAADAVSPAERDDPSVLLRRIVELVRGPEGRGIEGLRPDEDLGAAGAGEELYQALLALDLRVALDEERKADPFRDHGFEKLSSLAVLIEIVRAEQD
jgi:hypothetical protein